MADLPRTDGGLRELALFAGAGGGILGGKLLGWRTVCAVEFDPYAASVLVARQNDGLLPPFPVWDDVRTFDGRPWCGVIDVVSGGFPCQDISAAGKGGGIDGERSGLWREMARIVGEVRPRFVFVENSPILTSRGLGTVLGDLAALGFDAEWGVLGAADVGAPHQRDRIWIVAYSAGEYWNEWRPEPEGQQRPTGLADGCNGVANSHGLRELQPQGSEREQWGRAGNGGENVADTDEIGRRRGAGMLGPGRGAESADGGDDVSDALRNGHERGQPAEPPPCLRRRSADEDTSMCHTDGAGLAQRKSESSDDGEEQPAAFGADWWAVEPDVGRMAHGVAARVDRLKCLGNGQVPACAAEAFRRLCERVMEV